MKKTLCLIITAALLACALLPVLAACDSGGVGGTDKLYVYNWENYIDLRIIKENFPAYYKDVTGRSLEIVYTTFDTNETMMTKVLKGDANVDLICPSEYSIEKLMRADCLLNQRDVYNDVKPQLERYGVSLEAMSSINDDGYGNIEPGIMDVIKPMFNGLECADGKTYNMTEYMVPYFWGTLGILYNTSVISLEELEEYGWGGLWNRQDNKKLYNNNCYWY